VLVPVPGVCADLRIWALLLFFVFNVITAARGRRAVREEFRSAQAIPFETVLSLSVP
jgi:hypothetical protein